MSLVQLRDLAERDIQISAPYLSNPWNEGKFLDAISVYSFLMFPAEQDIDTINLIPRVT